uniref:Membrane protein BRI3 n=1 Tax=Apteryx owenii TaxID=8824 RepID=A0A8B9NQT9_APTOW
YRFVKYSSKLHFCLFFPPVKQFCFHTFNRFIVVVCFTRSDSVVSSHFRICCSSTISTAKLFKHVHHYSTACYHHFCSSSWRLSCLQSCGRCPAPILTLSMLCKTGVGVLEDTFTCLGVLCAIVFFPIGILFCLALRQRRCPNCGAAFG